MALYCLLTCPNHDVAGGSSQRTITSFMGAPEPTEPPAFGTKDDAGGYDVSPQWLTDVFLSSTEKERS